MTSREILEEVTRVAYEVRRDDSVRFADAGPVSRVIRERLPNLGVDPVCAATVVDNSMESPVGPSLAKGDIVLLAPEPKFHHGSLVFVIFKSKDRTIALVRQLMFEENEHLILQPLNSEFPLEFLAQDDVEALYRVVGRIEVYRDLEVNSRS